MAVSFSFCRLCRAGFRSAAFVRRLSFGRLSFGRLYELPSASAGGDVLSESASAEIKKDASDP